MLRFNSIYLGLLVLGVPMMVAAAPMALKGKPTIILGDRLSVDGLVVHLKGIDAPENGQQCHVATGRAFDCGLVSKTALMDLTVAISVTCNLTGAKRGEVPEAQCFGGGYDLSKGMVHTGWALAWPTSGTIYSEVERAAQKAGRGLWGGKFTKPWRWRKNIDAVRYR